MRIAGLQFDTTDKILGFTPALQAFYINGWYATPPRYGRGRVYIDVLGNDPGGAMWLDVERGDVTPDRVPGWLDERAPFGEGGVYVNRDNLDAVEQAAGDRDHLLWLATLDGTLDVPQVHGRGRVVLVQAIPAAMIGINADVSVVTDPAYWAAHRR